jgi:ribosomal protein L2
MSKNNLSTYYKVYKNFLKKIKNKNINYKPLVGGLLKKTGGRNNTGKITSYHRGGGVKRLYKKVLYSYFELLKCNLCKWIVERIEYDSTKTSNIVLLKNFNKIKKIKIL